MLQSYEAKSIHAPANATGAGVTGSYVDLQGYNFERNFKAVLLAGAGTTAGTCGGSIQSASDTSGTGLATETTFSGLTSAGGIEEKHFTITAGNRYVRFLGSVQSGKDMNLGALLVGGAVKRP